MDLCGPWKGWPGERKTGARNCVIRILAFAFRGSAPAACLARYYFASRSVASRGAFVLSLPLLVLSILDAAIARDWDQFQGWTQQLFGAIKGMGSSD